MAELQVLHVDDEPDMRLLVKLSLALDAGISTRSASSGTEALDATAYWKPDVILLDAVMPGMDGLATLQALQTNPRTAGIPVLFLTGKCTASDIDNFRASGSAGVIAKPFDPQALATAIRGYVQATAIVAPQAGPAPHFAGRPSGQDGGGTGNRGFAIPIGWSTAFGASGSTTEALLLDGNGNGFALTITDRSADRGGTMSSAAGSWVPGLGPDADAAQAAPALTVKVAALDAATVHDLLGLDPTTLLEGDGRQAAPPDPTAIAGAAFAIGHAIGCAPTGGAIDPPAADHAAAGRDGLYHSGPITPSGDWSALILPRALMH